MDDDASMANSTRYFVLSFGLRAEAFASAQEFLSSSLVEETRCLILDIRMPGIHRGHLMRKMGAKSLADLVRTAERLQDAKAGRNCNECFQWNRPRNYAGTYQTRFRCRGTPLSMSNSMKLMASSNLVLIDGDVSKKETTVKVAQAPIELDLLFNNGGIFIAKPVAEPGNVKTPKQAKDDRAHQFERSDHIFALHGLKLGIAGVLALFVAQTLRLQYVEWSVFTVTTLMMAHYYPGSIALKSFFRCLGTLVGASLGVWLVGDYLSAPILFLSVTFLVTCFASCKVGHLSLKMAPYASFATGITLIIVESTGLTQPDKEWFVALSRVEETFVGVAAVLVVTPLFSPTHPSEPSIRSTRKCCNFVVEPKIGVDDRKFSSSPRTNPK
jgi:hypothetical protein